MPEKQYDHNQIELKWSERWANAPLFQAEELSLIHIYVSRGSADSASYLDSLTDPVISIITAQELIAVSYTHLDVYKRQPLRNSPPTTDGC